jgi:hypothetical protein
MLADQWAESIRIDRKQILIGLCDIFGTRSPRRLVKPPIKGVQNNFSQISTGRKTLLIGVLGLKTDGKDYNPEIQVGTDCLGTENELEDDASYAHITVFQPISQSGNPKWMVFCRTDRFQDPDARSENFARSH